MGYEKPVLDADRLGGLQRLLQGFATDENGLARDAYAEVDPGNHFLGCAHTLANYETAFYDSALSDSESFERWVETGSLDATQSAHTRWQALLAAHDPPPLTPLRTRNRRNS